MRRCRLNRRGLKAFDNFLRHPVTLLVLGFALTAGVGGGISAWVQRVARDADAQRQEQRDADVALTRLVQAESELEVRWAEVILEIRDGGRART